MIRSIPKRNIACLATLLAAAVIFAFPGRAATGLNPQINFQGKLTDSTGSAVADGPQDFVFKLYTAPSGGNAIWTETWSSATRFSSTLASAATSSATFITYANDAPEANLAIGDALYNNTANDEVLITAFDAAANTIAITPTSKAWSSADAITTRISTRSGLVSVRLGSITSLSSVDFNQDTLYLGVTVGTDPEMTPHKRLTAVPQVKPLASPPIAIPQATNSSPSPRPALLRVRAHLRSMARAQVQSWALWALGRQGRIRNWKFTTAILEFRKVVVIWNLLLAAVPMISMG